MNGHEVVRSRAGGFAALYLALALLAAIPFFLVVVDYPSATTAAAKVAMILGNYWSMYAMYLVSYVGFGFALGVVALALYDRLRGAAPSGARYALCWGLLWAGALVASGLVFTYGMTTVITLAATDRAQAVVAWTAMEPIALALGGAGGELLGGVWMVTVGATALRGAGLPRALAWFGIIIGIAGIASVAPPLKDLAMVFGLLQIAWFAWLGVVLLRRPGRAQARTTEAAGSGDVTTRGHAVEPTAPAAG